MPKENRPNILLLHTDQQRFDTIAALGASHMTTPNLDRLVRNGRTFRRAFSSNPVCMPARHDLLTGAAARHHGYYSNTNDFIRDHALATTPRLLQRAGYQTLAVGKMHHNPPREHHGWAHMFLMEELPESREDDAYLQYLEQVGFGHIRCQHGVRPLFYHTPQVSRVPEEHHGSAWVAHKAIELIREPREKPFFLFASWVGPHPPYYVPESYLEMYRDRELPPPCPLPAGNTSARRAPKTPKTTSRAWCVCEKPISPPLRSSTRMSDAFSMHLRKPARWTTPSSSLPATTGKCSETVPPTRNTFRTKARLIFP
jgi:arylsulfatase A-like enzyme